MDAQELQLNLMERQGLGKDLAQIDYLERQLKQVSNSHLLLLLCHLNLMYYNVKDE